MTSLIHNRVCQYRQRAEEARTRADLPTNQARREELLQIAETWERMADYEEKHPAFGERGASRPSHEARPDND